MKLPADLIDHLRDWHTRWADVQIAMDEAEINSSLYPDADDMSIDHSYEGRELLLLVIEHIGL
jgi:hypothetical protein